MKKSIIVISVIAAILCGCATNYAEKSPTEVSDAVMVKDSEFDNQVTYIGPQAFSETRRGLFVDNETVQLVAAKNKKTGVVSYFIYTRILYTSGWRFYNSASLTNGNRLQVKSLGQVVNSCSGSGCAHTEEVSIPISSKELESDNHFKYRLNSKNGAENIITINKNYIDGFFQYLKKNSVI